MIWVLILVIIITSLYGLMVLGFLYGLLKIKEAPDPINKAPQRISVVCAVRNEEDKIDNLLTSLTALDYPKELYEIILVNDNSTDNSWRIAEEWMLRIPNLVLLELSPEKSGKKHALSLGVMQAINSIVVFTDADCSHHANWLSEISDSYRIHKWCLLIGPVMLSPANTFFAKIQALEHVSLTASTLGSCLLGYPVLASSANLAFNKETVNYNSEMLNLKQPSGDDVFLLHSIKKKKCATIKCMHSSDSIVLSKPVDSFKDFLLQRARWASKASAYRDTETILISTLVFLFNLMIVGIFISAFLVNQLFIIALIVYLVKIIVDFPLLFIFLKRYEQTSLLKVYLPLQLFYPFYVVFAFGLSLIMPVHWKGRKS